MTGQTVEGVFTDGDLRRCLNKSMDLNEVKINEPEQKTPWRLLPEDDSSRHSGLETEGDGEAEPLLQGRLARGIEDDPGRVIETPDNCQGSTSDHPVAQHHSW